MLRHCCLLKSGGDFLDVAYHLLAVIEHFHATTEGLWNKWIHPGRKRDLYCDRLMAFVPANLDTHAPCADAGAKQYVPALCPIA